MQLFMKKGFLHSSSRTSATLKEIVVGNCALETKLKYVTAQFNVYDLSRDSCNPLSDKASF